MDVKMMASRLTLGVLVMIGFSYGYMVPGSLEEIFYGHVRVKRQPIPTKTRFTQAEQDNIVAKHNEFRRVPNAANMLYMSWDDKLEDKAQDWVNKCKYDHNPDKYVTSSGASIVVGENLYAGTGGYNETTIVTTWYNEVSDYTYNTNTCAAVCGHYTQIVWATSHKVGCGIKLCATVTGLPWTNVYLAVCNYVEAGNLINTKPYVQGTSCSQCPAGKTTCDNKLCREDTSVITRATTMMSEPSSFTSVTSSTTSTSTTEADCNTLQTCGATAVTSTVTTLIMLSLSQVFIHST